METNSANSPSVDRFTHRAKEGEQVWVLLSHVRADKREQFEHFVHDLLTPAAAKSLPVAHGQTRFLHPVEPNEDGSYTYVFLMDPVVGGADYRIDHLLQQMYGDELAAEYNKIWHESMIGTQVGYTLVQSRI